MDLEAVVMDQRAVLEPQVQVQLTLEAVAEAAETVMLAVQEALEL